ncbi:MAG TPA: hypothetical protein VHE60_09755 [Pyrinomonadaceae bacterium]|nr:hypothetical protein [Pyrinomonadaceae bacterium]
MRIFDDGDYDGFYKALTRAVPIYGDLPLFDAADNQKFEAAAQSA